ncbi:hypothetical protein DRQ25_18445 [Candidatus Fermentibacteria bacterium]|nr:MAG: hypothetical protein DRQ25_18445 [Candidatus Fermentibacteria bacterium]
MKLTAEQIQAIKSWALVCYPEEMCGIITEGVFKTLPNSAENPKEAFRIDEKLLLPFLGKIDAIVHSHCHNPKKPTALDVRTPSSADVQGQISSGVPWLIVGVDGSMVTPAITIPREPSASYLERPFIWFINDCYTLVQDYYQFELGIALTDHKIDKDYKTLRNYDNLFERYIKEYGFKETDSIEGLKNGDLLLLNNGVATCNHLGIYHNGEVLHQDEMSVSQPFVAFIGRINKVLKYVG